jgi:ubiquinone/menaquinone biosynthesis C-methylase UbiE
MTGLLDPEGVEARVLHDLVDFNDKDVLEIGCGDGRMTWFYADAAASVLAIDPAEDSIATARKETPDHLSSKVSFRVASMVDIELPDAEYDVGVLSWSL